VAQILIVEDEERIAAFLEKGLAADGHATTVVDDGDAAARFARSGLFDLVVLDLGLPGKDGLQVLGELRAAGDRTPVVILTARSGVEHVVKGLELGADDYLTKPFAFDELLARVRARLRDSGTPDATTLAVAGHELDLRTRRLHGPGDEVEDLTSREFALAELLFRHPGQVLSREQILSQVWGFDYDPGSNIVDVYISNLRRKLGGDVIETIRGVGYRLRTEEPAS
jgi:DNA-binding response OmpR family regulator